MHIILDVLICMPGVQNPPTGKLKYFLVVENGIRMIGSFTK